MSAMDNATRNAGEMIGKLTLRYNRTRQATITKELIEIISGAGGALNPIYAALERPAHCRSEDVNMPASANRPTGHVTQ